MNALTITKNFPEGWDEIDVTMSNLDGKIPSDMEKKLKKGKVFGRHPGWNFNGLVYYEKGLFKEQVWVYHVPIKTVIGRTLEELMTAVNDEFGYD
jgi:hypothetical protein